MSTIVTRAGKGSALTHTEVDANFTNLNTDKIQSGNTVASLTVTSISGTTATYTNATISSADINGGTIDGTSIGSSSASTGAFTTLSASSTVSGTGFSNYLASPPAIGGSTPAAITGTTITANTAFSGPLNGSVGATTPAAGTFTSLTDSGNLTFTGTGNRITGDFSNATLANRVSFQTNTTNGNTSISFLPNGTSTTSTLRAYNNPDPTNSGVNNFGINNGEVFFQSAITGTGTYLPMTFYTGGSERMRVDTSGRVGIGTVPSAWTLAANLDVGAASVVGNSTNAYFSANQYYDGAWKYKADGFSTTLLQTNGNFDFYTAPTGLANAAATQTLRMRLTPGGDLGIGTSSPGAKLHVSQGNTSVGALLNGTTRGIRFGFDATSSIIEGVDNTGVSSFQPLTVGGVDVRFTTSGTERARIDSSGNLLVGTTSAVTTSGAGVKILNNGGDPFVAEVNAASTSAVTTWNVYSTGAGAFRFYVGLNGTIFATSTSISAISDQSLKENIRDLETGLTQVMALRPRRFDWKNGDGKDVAGFIAQEVEPVLPDLVYDYKYTSDETKKSLKMGDILPTLVKAIQEQQQMIEELKAKVAALEEK
jgi:hypothetical protein